jgi:hypothetical protein
MGYQLNKPDLRREMEAECNHVAAGRKTKEEIMIPILEKMRQCYETATQERHSWTKPSLATFLVSVPVTLQPKMQANLANAASVITKWRHKRSMLVATTTHVLKMVLQHL